VAEEGVATREIAEAIGVRLKMPVAPQEAPAYFARSRRDRGRRRRWLRHGADELSPAQPTRRRLRRDRARRGSRTSALEPALFADRGVASNEVISFRVRNLCALFHRMVAMADAAASCAAKP
jgi:hypothetical protein